MKKLTLEATDENVLNSIRENTFNRRKDIKDFIQALDMVEGNAFISLDARWGEGKTFYVRQVEKTLEYLVKKTWGEPEDIEDLEQYFESTGLENIKLNQSYLPIYYNAWLYDNHNDPLMSLLFVVAKKCKQYLDTKIDSGIVGEKIKGLLASISINNIPIPFNNNIPISVDGEKVKDAFAGKDILQKIKMSEEIREEVKRIFNDIIVEDAQKLVIFIDELDRCRPSFAIEVLERIKHYFDDDRIIFIISVNKEQLIHTISKYYGVGFDSTGYLNKFFDLNIYMPAIESINRRFFERSNREQYYLSRITEGLSEYYELTFRDGLIYKLRMSDISLRQVNDFTTQGKCLSIFIPLIVILDIINIPEKVKFLDGKSDILKTLSKDITAMYRVVHDFGTGSTESTEEEQYNVGYDRVKEVYDYAFGRSDNYPALDVNRDIKEICIRMCNGFPY